MINFGNIGVGNIVDTVLPPREIFNALPNKNAKKFQYPRDVQSQVWTKWFNRREEPNLVLKMNTGGGKTIVGLLILKSCLNEKKYPAAYICPDPYLVRQVVDSAKELGIEVTEDAKSHRFISGKAILVANIHKLVNGKSVFGVGDEGEKISLSSLVIDDAHACIETIETQFTINIPAESEVYPTLMDIFRETLKQQGESKLVEIEEGDKSNYMQVPYWIWQEKMSDISRALIKHKDQDFLRFVWPLLKEQLELSTCIVSASKIEISPHAIPIHMIPSIVNAHRKIFMTATLVDDSILISHFGVEQEHIEKPIVPESAGDIGDRMILLPQIINTQITDDEIKKYAKELSKQRNVVVIVPSYYRATYWNDVCDLQLDKDNLYEGVEKLKNSLVGLTVLVNRYDGVDLPADACRVLILDGLPDVRNLKDKVKQSVLLGSNFLINQTIQRIEQGMGRGVRSNDDHCVVMLIGRDLTNHLYSQGAREKLSIGSFTQLQLSEQVASQITGQSIEKFSEVFEYCFSENQQWLTASKGALASLKYDEVGHKDTMAINLRSAYDLALNHDIHNACKKINSLVNSERDTKVKGYLKQILAEYINTFDQVEAQQLQLSSVSDNRRLLKPITGIQYLSLPKNQRNVQAENCSNFLRELGDDPNKLLIKIKGIICRLSFEPDSSNHFEEAMKLIARYIGFESQRPEQEYGRGPDVLWSLGELNYLVIECKNETVTDTITKGYCNQLNGSCYWFEEKYDDSCSFIPIMIHNSYLFDFAASPNQYIRIMTPEMLQKFCIAVDDFLTAVIASKSFKDTNGILQKLIHYKLRSLDLVNTYTVPFRKRS
jgi:hypothetical protein